MQTKKEKKKSLWMDEAAQKALFHGLDELGEDHKDLQRLSSRKSVLGGEGDVGGGGLTTHDVTINTNKATSKSSYNTRAPDKTPSFSDLTKNITSPIPEVDEFRQRKVSKASEKAIRVQTNKMWEKNQSTIPFSGDSGFFESDGLNKLIPTEDMLRGLNKYFDHIDSNNKKHRQCAQRLMITFGVCVTLFIVIFLLFVNHGYQEMEQINGFVTTKVTGVGTARSPLMKATDALIYDTKDVVVPSKEKNALFLTTKSYQIGQEQGTCVGLDTCTCPTSDQMCPTSCPINKIGASGIYTGRCVRLSSEGVVPEDRRCEVKTWCPVIDVKHAEISQTVDPAMKVSGVDKFQIHMTVNGYFPTFDQNTQYNLTTSVMELIHATEYSSWEEKIIAPGGGGGDDAEKYKVASRKGAIYFVQFVYDCDIDRFHANQCTPILKVTHLTDDNEALGEGTSAAVGYGFKTVDYFMKDTSTTERSRRVRHLKGLRFIFDVTGRARKFNFGFMFYTVLRGFGFAALAFIIVNEGRLLCESKRATKKTEEELKREGIVQTRKAMQEMEDTTNI